MGAASCLAALRVGADLRPWCLFHNNVAVLMKVFTGDLVAGILKPNSPALVKEVTKSPKRESNGFLSVLLKGPRDFHASMAADLTESGFTDGMPASSRRSAIGGRADPVRTTNGSSHIIDTGLKFNNQGGVRTIMIEMGEDWHRSYVTNSTHKKGSDHFCNLVGREVNFEAPR